MATFARASPTGEDLARGERASVDCAGEMLGPDRPPKNLLSSTKLELAPSKLGTKDHHIHNFIDRQATEGHIPERRLLGRHGDTLVKAGGLLKPLKMATLAT